MNSLRLHMGDLLQNLQSKLAHSVTSLTFITKVSNSCLGHYIYCVDTHSLTS